MSEGKPAAKRTGKKTAHKTAPGKPEEQTEFHAVTKEPLNFRSGPGFEYEIICVLGAGAALALTGKKENGFAEAANAAGTRGWVCMEFIEVNGLD